MPGSLLVRGIPPWPGSYPYDMIPSMISGTLILATLLASVPTADLAVIGGDAITFGLTWIKWQGVSASAVISTALNFPL